MPEIFHRRCLLLMFMVAGAISRAGDRESESAQPRVTIPQYADTARQEWTAKVTKSGAGRQW